MRLRQACINATKMVCGLLFIVCGCFIRDAQLFAGLSAACLYASMPLCLIAFPVEALAKAGFSGECRRRGAAVAFEFPA